MGDKVKNCCCMTGSTDAATELVDKATLLKTLTAIQSLDGLISKLLHEQYTWHSLKEELQDLEGAEGRVASDSLQIEFSYLFTPLQCDNKRTKSLMT